MHSAAARAFQAVARASWATTATAKCSAGVLVARGPTYIPNLPALLTSPGQPGASFASQMFTSAAKVVRTEAKHMQPVVKPFSTGTQNAAGVIARRSFSGQAGAQAESAGAAEYLQLAAGMATFVTADMLLKKGAAAADITIPAPLLGMFGIITTLWGLSAAGQQGSADAIVRAFRPALTWLQRWLPLFYVAPLVVLPVAVSKMEFSDAAKLGTLVLLGMPLSLFATAYLVLGIRSITRTTLMPVATTPPLPPFSSWHFMGWGAAAVAGLLGMLAVGPDTTLDVPAVGPFGGQMSAQNVAATTFLLSSTVFGLLFGSVPPAAIAAVMPHPVVTTALFGTAACAVAGNVSGGDYFDGMKTYLTKGKDGAALGAGDVLMGFLGCVILSFGFHIYGQRALMSRHAAEVLGCAAGSSLLSLVGTAAVGRAMDLPPDLSLAAAPRSITVALALPIAETLGVSPDALPLCAAAVVATGLLGAATCQRLLNIGRFKDPVTRGMATAGSCHGLGTAALAAKEPEALPFCALAYGLIGISGTMWASVPVVKDLLRWIAGADNEDK